MKKYIPHLVIFLIGALAGMWAHRQYNRTHTELVVQTDTLVVRDTHIIEKPVLVERIHKDSLLVAVHDTTRIHDTLYLALPRETKVYSDTDYYAEVSGYEPTLDYLEVYPKTTTITQSVTSTPKLNSLGIGVETNFMSSLSTPIYIEYERTLKPWLSVYGQIAYDLPSQKYGAGVGLKMQIGW